MRTHDFLIPYQQFKSGLCNKYFGITITHKSGNPENYKYYDYITIMNQSKLIKTITVCIFSSFEWIHNFEDSTFAGVLFSFDGHESPTYINIT
jgi:hypothetical protein